MLLQSIEKDKVGPSQKFFQCLKLSFSTLDKIPKTFELLMKEFLSRGDLSTPVFAYCLSSYNLFFSDYHYGKNQAITNIKEYINTKFSLQDLKDAIRNESPESSQLAHLIRAANIVHSIQTFSSKKQVESPDASTQAHSLAN